MTEEFKRSNLFISHWVLFRVFSATFTYWCRYLIAHLEKC